MLPPCHCVALVGPCVRHSSARGWRQTLLGLRLQTCLDHCVMVSPASPVVTSGSSQIWGWTHFAWLVIFQFISNDGDWSWHIPMLLVGWYYWRESEHTPGSDWFHHRLLHISTSYHLPDSSCFCLFWQMCLFGSRGNFAWPQTFLQFFRELKKKHFSIGVTLLCQKVVISQNYGFSFWIGTSLLSGSFSYVKNQDGRILLFPPLPIIDSWLSPHCWTAELLWPPPNFSAISSSKGGGFSHHVTPTGPRACQGPQRPNMDPTKNRDVIGLEGDFFDAMYAYILWDIELFIEFLRPHGRLRDASELALAQKRGTAHS